uniref:Uncharacterized protein n=1 Tax=Arundo donax TaxID=35708 RepID=A0A0A9FNK7_ARUDO
MHAKEPEKRSKYYKLGNRKSYIVGTAALFCQQ